MATGVAAAALYHNDAMLSEYMDGDGERWAQ